MVSIQPALAVCSIVMTGALCVKFSSSRATLARLRWLVPTLVIIALINSLIAPGSENSISFGWLSFSFEGLIYGACMGAMFFSAAILFMVASDAISTDDAMSLAKGRFPTLALMLSMSLGAIPRLRRTATETASVEKANSWMRNGTVHLKDSADGRSRKVVRRPSVFQRALDASKAQTRRMNVLFDVSMDDSILTADSIRARGWGEPNRSSFRRRSLRSTDITAIVLILTIGACAVVANCISSFDFSFYPRISWGDISSWPSLIGCALMILYTLLGMLGLKND